MEEPRTDQTRPAQAGEKTFALAIAELLSAIAFLSTWAPCLLGKNAGGFPLPIVSSFCFFASIGCLLTAAIIAMRPRNASEIAQPRSPLAWSLATYEAGFLLFAITPVLSNGTILAGFAGILAGSGITSVGAWLCSRAREMDFSSVIAWSAATGLGVFAVISAIEILPSSIKPFSCAFLALAAGAGIAFCARRLSPEKMGKNDRKVLTKQSDRTPFDSKATSIFIASTVGFVPFVLLSNIQICVPIGQFTFDAASGLLIGSILILATISLFKDKIVSPSSLWAAFPAWAGLLVISNSFPKETFVSALSAGLAFAYFSVLSMFSIACLLYIAARSPLAPKMACLPFALIAAAHLMSIALGKLEVSMDQTGAAILVITTTYFVFLIMTLAFQLWRSHKEGGREGLGGAHDQPNRQDKTKAFDESCRDLANAHGLSRRECEVFLYLTQGYTSTYIAKELYISDSTVRSHTKSIYRKLGVNSRIEAIEKARRFAQQGIEE